MCVVCKVQKNGDLDPIDTRLFATRGPLLRESDQLYRFPFGNIYSDGRVCWGRVEYKTGIKSLAQAASLLETFLFHTMNTDLYTGRGDGLETYLKSLQDAGEFPYEDLTPDLTFRDIASLLKGKNV